MIIKVLFAIFIFITCVAVPLIKWALPAIIPHYLTLYYQYDRVDGVLERKLFGLLTLKKIAIKNVRCIKVLTERSRENLGNNVDEHLDSSHSDNHREGKKSAYIQTNSGQIELKGFAKLTNREKVRQVNQQISQLQQTGESFVISDFHAGGLVFSLGIVGMVFLFAVLMDKSMLPEYKQILKGDFSALFGNDKQPQTLEELRDNLPEFGFGFSKMGAEAQDEDNTPVIHNIINPVSAEPESTVGNASDIANEGSSAEVADGESNHGEPHSNQVNDEPTVVSGRNLQVPPEFGNDISHMDFCRYNTITYQPDTRQIQMFGKTSTDPQTAHDIIVPTVKGSRWQPVDRIRQDDAVALFLDREDGATLDYVITAKGACIMTIKNIDFVSRPQKSW
ncbi:hypothetical protein [Psychrobacter sp. I-STPA6b]|uniref:hypothetical protein n=1 Tax=Psychrobacter sp. I-STPA6b TaxID=2585718 RepID=UPI001D0C2921|nr:hypothetical protein [Psychrobacter sp. I-STPA6b]